MESTKVKRATVAERFRKQMDHLTGDERATEGSEAIDFRTLSSSAFDSASSATVGKTDQKSDYESLRSRFRFRPSAEMIFLKS